ncbi:MAG: hypothetical protein ACFCVF_14025 [Kineosporiaceae bacterium]
MNDLDVLESVQSFRSHVPEPDEARVERARQEFRVARARAHAGTAPARRRSWRVRVRVMAGAATALAAALAVGVVGLPGTGPTVDPAAAATLDAAADAVAAQPSVAALADGQYWYRAEVEYSSVLETDDGVNPSASTSTSTYEIWMGRDASGRILTTGRDEGDIDLTWLKLVCSGLATRLVDHGEGVAEVGW